MTKFRVLPQSKLSEQDFDDYPVWSEHYDWDEIEDIERWGLDREYVFELFRENSSGDEHCVYTLLESNPFPPRMRIFIRARITATDGRRLKGYIMNEDAFCLAIFYGDQEFIFSRHPMLHSDNKEHDQQLLQSIGNSATVFPVKYETDFKDRQGHPITGEFMYGTRMKS
jgi:hypothetical protein